MKTKYIFNRMKKSHCCTVRCMSETHIFKHNCPKADLPSSSTTNYLHHHHKEVAPLKVPPKDHLWASPQVAIASALPETLSQSTWRRSICNRRRSLETRVEICIRPRSDGIRSIEPISGLRVESTAEWTKIAHLTGYYTLSSMARIT